MSHLDDNRIPTELRPLGRGDLARYKEAISRGKQMGFAYYFPALLASNRPGKSSLLIYEEQNSICIFRLKQVENSDRLDLLLAPSPMNPDVLKNCLAIANDFNEDRSARVLRIDEKDQMLCTSLPNLRLRQRRAQYIFKPSAFADIRGNKFRTFRRNVAKIQALDSVEVRPYSTDDKDDVLNLLRRWKDHHRAVYGTRGAVGNTRRMIELASDMRWPDVQGEVILIDGRLSAFSFGGEIRPGYGAYLEAKSDPEIPGLSYFQRYSYLSKLEQFDLVNDGSDVGRAGLAQLKNSMRPVAMHREYRGEQKPQKKIISIATNSRTSAT